MLHLFNLINVHKFLKKYFVTQSKIRMDELSILDMDELAIKHSKMEFQEQMKNSSSETVSHSKQLKNRKNKNKDVKNEGDSNGNSETDTTVAVMAELNLLDSFQPLKQTSGMKKLNSKFNQLK